MVECGYSRDRPNSGSFSAFHWIISPFPVLSNPAWHFFLLLNYFELYKFAFSSRSSETASDCGQPLSPTIPGSALWELPSVCTHPECASITYRRIKQTHIRNAGQVSSWNRTVGSTKRSFFGRNTFTARPHWPTNSTRLNSALDHKNCNKHWPN